MFPLIHASIEGGLFAPLIRLLKSNGRCTGSIGDSSNRGVGGKIPVAIRFVCGVTQLVVATDARADGLILKHPVKHVCAEEGGLVNGNFLDVPKKVLPTAQTGDRDASRIGNGTDVNRGDIEDFASVGVATVLTVLASDGDMIPAFEIRSFN